MVSRNKFRRGARATALGASLAALIAGGAQAADFLVEMNKSRALHFPQPVATIMVGNPAIADVTVEGSQLVYVMGRSYGRTNIVALDSDGKAIADMNVSVVAQNASTVTLTRGAGQYSYNCTPRCERVPAMGDSPESFATLMSQMSTTAGSSGSAGGTDSGASSGDGPMY